MAAAEVLNVILVLVVLMAVGMALMAVALALSTVECSGGIVCYGGGG